jgi:hypothetical protein
VGSALRQPLANIVPAGIEIPGRNGQTAKASIWVFLIPLRRARRRASYAGGVRTSAQKRSVRRHALKHLNSNSILWRAGNDCSQSSAS